jgi:hypothetical protein
MTRREHLTLLDAGYKQPLVSRLKSVFCVKGRSGPEAVTKSLICGAPGEWTQTFVNSCPIPNDDILVVSGDAALSETANFSCRPVVVGPNLDPKLSWNMRALKKMASLNSLKYFLVPSHWVADIYKSHHETSWLPIEIWSAGADTSYWTPDGSVERSQVIVYIKDPSALDLIEEVLRAIQQQGLRAKIIQYGKYTEREYLRALQTSQALVYLGGTESQGLALLESWSADVPTLVLSNTTRHVFGRDWPASSAPYLTEATGQFFERQPARRLRFEVSEFTSTASQRTPREWVKDHQTVQHAARELRYIYDTIDK